MNLSGKSTNLLKLLYDGMPIGFPSTPHLRHSQGPSMFSAPSAIRACIVLLSIRFPFILGAGGFGDTSSFLITTGGGAGDGFFTTIWRVIGALGDVDDLVDRGSPLTTTGVEELEAADTCRADAIVLELGFCMIFNLMFLLFLTKWGYFFRT